MHCVACKPFYENTGSKNYDSMDDELTAHRFVMRTMRVLSQLEDVIAAAGKRDQFWFSTYVEVPGDDNEFLHSNYYLKMCFPYAPDYRAIGMEM